MIDNRMVVGASEEYLSLLVLRAKHYYWFLRIWSAVVAIGV